MLGLISATFVTRMLVGGVVLLAAGLKTHDLLATPRADSASSLRTNAAEFALIAAECLLAAWLLSGRQWPAARGLAIVWMIALCGVSLYKAATGAASCGCFGRFQVNPWITVTLDVAALGALSLSPIAADAMLGSWRHGALYTWQIILLCALGLVLRSPFRRPSPAPAGSTELDPAKWVNQRPWVMGEYIDKWAEISHGKWVVLLYSPDCRACTSTRDSYEQLALKWRTDKSPIRVALIDTLDEPDDYAPNSPAWYGTMRAPADWYIPTPTLVILIDGRVIDADSGYEQCQWNDREFPGG